MRRARRRALSFLTAQVRSLFCIWSTAIITNCRAVREETGCDIAVRPGSVGAIIEYRDSKKLLQISYCFLVDAVGDRSAVEFTEEERQRGAELEWMRLEDAIAALEKDTPTDYAGQFIRKRDLLFLEKAKELLD